MSRKAGSSTRERQKARRFDRKALCLFGIAVVVCLMILMLAGLRIGGLVSLAITAACLVFLKYINTDFNAAIDHVLEREKHSTRGAEAEEKVGGLLETLDKKRFQIFHDVVLGYGNIDHILLRRDGAIFIVETKSHFGKISQDGFQLLRDGYPLEKDFIKQTLGQVMRLREQLMGYAGRDLWVNGILCFTKGFIQVRGPIKGIRVVPSKWLLEKLDEGKVNEDLADWLWEYFATLLTLPPKAVEPPSLTVE